MDLLSALQDPTSPVTRPPEVHTDIHGTQPVVCSALLLIIAGSKLEMMEPVSSCRIGPSQVRSPVLNKPITSGRQKDFIVATLEGAGDKEIQKTPQVHLWGSEVKGQRRTHVSGASVICEML